MHWDHEPRNRSAGRKAPINRTHSKRFALAESADRATAFGVRASSAPLSKACCDSVDGRFMESPLSFFRMHWDHEPVGRVTPCAPQFGNAQTARRGLTRPTFRFMESPLSVFRMD